MERIITTDCTKPRRVFSAAAELLSLSFSPFQTNFLKLSRVIIPGPRCSNPGTSIPPASLGFVPIHKRYPHSPCYRPRFSRQAAIQRPSSTLPDSWLPASTEGTDGNVYERRRRVCTCMRIYAACQRNSRGSTWRTVYVNSPTRYTYRATTQDLPISAVSR